MKLDKAAILIKRAALESDRVSNGVLEEAGLTISQYKVIKYVFEEGENGVRITDLEKYFSMSHPTAIGIVQNLEKKGYIAYTENPNDARSRYIIATDEALKQKDKLEAIGEELEKEMTKNLSEKERQELILLLRKMMNIKEEE